MTLAGEGKGERRRERNEDRDRSWAPGRLGESNGDQRQVVIHDDPITIYIMINVFFFLIAITIMINIG